MKSAIIAALPRELAGLVQGWSAVEGQRRHVRMFRQGAALAVSAGIGPDRAALAVEAALADGGVGCLISVGLAGACDPGLRVGEVLRFGSVVDARSGERLAAESGRQEVLVSSNVIAAPEEKARLRASYGAAAVDMEAATVARLARAQGLEFRAIKAISDEADFKMPELRPYMTSEGQFQEYRFAAYTAVHPGSWRAAIALGRNSARAVVALTRELERELRLK